MPAGADPDRPDRRLAAALAEVDRVFAGLPRPGPVDGCTWCYSADDLVRLGGDPDEVPDDLLRSFAHEGADHWSADQYGLLWRRFAPRVLRTVAYHRDELVVPWALRGPGSPSAGFGRWPPAHRDAVTGAYAALLAVALVDWPSGDVVELLGPLVRLDDIAAWFARIDPLAGDPPTTPAPGTGSVVKVGVAAGAGPVVEAGLVRLVAHWAVELLDGTPPHWYDPPGDPVGLATGWLCSPAVRDRVAGFARRYPGCRTATEAGVALTALELGEAELLWELPGGPGVGCGCPACGDQPAG
ncbi:hypothetical protein [Micromonospora cathayae]|uniref:Uncharacterized protein n=1 Tax=Micromonospora cathayae TaxID=3028804 RepID=A0ABY7ZNM4_9ACTN|nr:hypothetical protein [Micromonospora sp. HUAS 3]WDZ84376.1 hypothetical protein PVK37_28695 [Micromonospora sp. HUAS 3]